MDYTKLLFAAQVRELAVRLRKNEAPDEAFADLDSRNEWLRQNPLSLYVPIALREIETVAQQLDGIKSPPN